MCKAMAHATGANANAAAQVDCCVYFCCLCWCCFFGAANGSFQKHCNGTFRKYCNEQCAKPQHMPLAPRLISSQLLCLLFSWYLCWLLLFLLLSDKCLGQHHAVCTQWLLATSFDCYIFVSPCSDFWMPHFNSDWPWSMDKIFFVSCWAMLKSMLNNAEKHAEQCWTQKPLITTMPQQCSKLCWHTNQQQWSQCHQCQCHHFCTCWLLCFLVPFYDCHFFMIVWQQQLFQMSMHHTSLWWSQGRYFSLTSSTLSGVLSG